MDTLRLNLAIGDKVLVKPHTEETVRIIEVFAIPRNTYFIGKFPAGYREGFFYAGITGFIGKIDGDEIILLKGIRENLKDVMDLYNNRASKEKKESQ